MCIRDRCSLAACYLSGIGAEIDEEKAVKWYTKAAKQGNEDAKEALEKIKAKQ